MDPNGSLWTILVTYYGPLINYHGWVAEFGIQEPSSSSDERRSNTGPNSGAGQAMGPNSGPLGLQFLPPGSTMAFQGAPSGAMVGMGGQYGGPMSGQYAGGPMSMLHSSGGLNAPASWSMASFQGGAPASVMPGGGYLNPNP